MKIWVLRRWFKNLFGQSYRSRGRTKAPQYRKLLFVECLEMRVAPSATISGRAFLDFNGNGVYDTSATIANASQGTVGVAVDQGLAGVTVQAFDSSNVLQGTAVTAADGTYTLNATGTGPYRIEFGALAGYTYSAVGQSGNPAIDGSSSVNFVADGSTSTLNIGFTNYPNEYTPDNPELVTSEYVRGAYNGANAAHPVIVSFNYNSGTQSSDATLGDYTDPTTHAIAIPQSAVGATWGLTWSNPLQTLFAGAYMKKFTGFGRHGRHLRAFGRQR